MSLKKTCNNCLQQKFVINYKLIIYVNNIVCYPKYLRTWLKMLNGNYFNEYYKLNLDISEIYFIHLSHLQSRYYKII